MSSSTNRAQILYCLHQWLGDPRLTDEPACVALDLSPATDLPIPEIKPNRQEVDALVGLGNRIINRCRDRMPQTPEGQASLPFDDPIIDDEIGNDSGLGLDVDSPSFMSLSKEERPNETSHGPVGRFRDVRAYYQRDLGTWPADAERLAATHMTDSEVAKARHFRNARHRSLKLRAEAMALHRDHVKNIASREAEITRLAEEGELHRQDAVRAGQDMANLCAQVRGREPLHPPESVSPLGSAGRNAHAVRETPPPVRRERRQFRRSGRA